MSSTAISVENISKQYRLGQVGTGTLSDDLTRLWCRLRGKEDPFLKIGQTNDRTKKADAPDPDKKSGLLSRLSPLASRNSPDLVWALKDINFEVKEGEVLGIIGRNGAGKSTLLKILARVTTPTTGEVKVKGRIASLLEVGTGFHPDLSGRENIYLNGAILGMRKHEITRKLDEIIDFSGCDRYIDTPVKRYSSGMYVRLAFAVAAHLDPEILIIDEVLAVGDAEFQKKCLGKMQDVAQGGRTVLFVSHNLISLRTLCQKGIVLQNGALNFEGTAEESVAAYLKESRKTCSQMELIQGPRSGTGYATFVSVRIRARDGQFVPCVASGEDFSIVTSYRRHENTGLENVVFSIALKDDFDNYCWLVRSSFDGEYLNLKDSEIVECHVNDFALAPGTYRATLFMSSRDNEVIDHVENAFELEVQAGAFFRSGNPGLPSHCKVLTRVQWNVC